MAHRNGAIYTRLFPVGEEQQHIELLRNTNRLYTVVVVATHVMLQSIHTCHLTMRPSHCRALQLFIYRSTLHLLVVDFTIARYRYDALEEWNLMDDTKENCSFITPESKARACQKSNGNPFQSTDVSVSELVP